MKTNSISANMMNKQYFTTGSIGLDYIISGGKGIPGGTFVELFGKSDSGKTATVMHMMKSNIDVEDINIMYFDFDGRFNKDYALAIGIDENTPKDKLAIISEPEMSIMTNLFTTIETLAMRREYNMFIIDTVATMTTEEEQSATYGDLPNAKHFMYQLDRGLKKLRRAFKAYGIDATVIFVNQVRDNFETGFGYKSAFDISIAANMDIRIDISRVENISRSTDMLFGHRRIGHRVEFRIVDNSVYRPGGRCQVSLYYSDNLKGFDIPSEALTYGLETGIISKNGSEYSIKMKYGDDVVEDKFTRKQFTEMWPKYSAAISKAIINILQKSDKWYITNSAEDTFERKEYA